MYLKKTDIEGMNRIKRINIINTVTGVKPANLIGTTSKQDGNNLAIISSVVHLGSNPALIGFVLRPVEEVPRHTYLNILENEVYTINQVHTSFVEQAHYTSAKFEKGVSEFQKCHFTPEWLHDFPAPYVQESSLKMGLRLVQKIPIHLNGTILMVGAIEHLYAPDVLFNEAGICDLTAIDAVGIGGLNTYYSLQKEGEFPFARPETLPAF